MEPWNTQVNTCQLSDTFSNYFLEMEHFVHMMLMTPVAALLMNFFGLPMEATALLGMLVPMFLMQQINASDDHVQK